MKPLSSSHIESIGVKLPDRIETISELTEKIVLPVCSKLEDVSGIIERRICSGEEDALFLSSEAAFDCISHSEFQAHEIEMVICCSISKFNHQLEYQYEPALSLQIRQKIGADHAIYFDITNACAGMISGVFIADNFIQQGIVRNCMVVSGEFISTIAHNASKTISTFDTKELASLTVGDAGAAVILSRNESDAGFEVLEQNTYARYQNLCYGALSTSFPGAYMQTLMKKLHKAALDESADFIEVCLKKHQLSFDKIDILIPHQTSQKAINIGAKRLLNHFKVKKAPKVVSNLELYGNTASTTHFIALYHLLMAKKVQKGERIMLLSHASGLVMGLVVFRLNAIVDRYGN